MGKTRVERLSLGIVQVRSLEGFWSLRKVVGRRRRRNSDFFRAAQVVFFFQLKDEIR